MAATILSLDHKDPERSYAQCRSVIRSGGIIAYPTDTFYGLGTDPRDPASVRRLFTIKRRRLEQPLLLLVSDIEEVEQWAAQVTRDARDLMDRYWPGPLTLVLQARAEVLPELTAGTGTIGLRVPGNEDTRSLLRSIGTALTGTSANRSGEPEPRTAGEVFASLGGELDLILDGGRANSERPSTIVDVSGSVPRIIRRGAIDLELSS
ncbi:MAG: L-threonylcarbamoyladenylate synthase [Nitrospirota bacterium]|nr:L-threonylcarbamoyladenylate synthase [Nitrospirota bacterium]